MKHLKRFNESAFESDEKFTSLGKVREINHAEIENILSEYGVVVDEMWGIPL